MRIMSQVNSVVKLNLLKCLCTICSGKKAVIRRLWRLHEVFGVKHLGFGCEVGFGCEGRTRNVILSKGLRVPGPDHHRRPGVGPVRGRRWAQAAAQPRRETLAFSGPAQGLTTRTAGAVATPLHLKSINDNATQFDVTVICTSSTAQCGRTTARGRPRVARRPRCRLSVPMAGLSMRCRSCSS